MSTPFKLSIPKPCSADWANMSIQEKGRHCELCSKSVHSLSEYEESEAVALLQQKVCVRVESNAHGQIKTRRGFSSILLLSGLLACGKSGEGEDLIGEIEGETYIVDPEPVDALKLTAGQPVELNVEKGVGVETPPRPLMGKIAPSKPVQVDTVTMGDVAVTHEEMGESLMETAQKESTVTEQKSSEEDCGNSADSNKQ